MSDPRVELFWWAECPSWEKALAITRKAIADADLDPDSIVVTEITSDEQAEELGFPGSPTIRIDGVDVHDPGDNPIGLSCRVYRRPDGRISPLPDRADIDAALARAAQGASTPVRKYGRTQNAANASPGLRPRSVTWHTPSSLPASLPGSPRDALATTVLTDGGTGR